MAVTDDQLPIEVQRRLHDAVRRFAGACFWNWDLERPITDRESARLVIRTLRLHGGRTGWQAAWELSQCL
ncbi:MAG: hypothetical protein RLZZ127_2088 [Planctomycetota bacterium]|jgi:hypothetical protein